MKGEKTRRVIDKSKGKKKEKLKLKVEIRPPQWHNLSFSFMI